MELKKIKLKVKNASTTRMDQIHLGEFFRTSDGIVYMKIKDGGMMDSYISQALIVETNSTKSFKSDAHVEPARKVNIECLF